MVRCTHTFAELELSQPAYDEIATKLREAGYDHAFTDEGAIDMHGIGVTRCAEAPVLTLKAGAIPLVEPAEYLQQAKVSLPPNLDANHLVLLQAQEHVMAQYSDILAQRLALWGLV